ncbi:MAG: prepilin-type N-terminal cleavage/methylation domain-containing protein [Candidatus Omnitrophota bacterium]|jgi:prepilin-type N-terminal cleavage/methylation domain-containing protein
MITRDISVCVQRKKAVTLIELVTVMVIVGVLTATSSLYVKGVIDLWRFISFRSESVSQGRMALMRMSREMRQIKDALSVYTAGSSEFRFMDVSDTMIRYRFSGNALIRGSNTIENVLVSGLSAVTFTYYNANNAPIASPLLNPQESDIYRIKIAMVFVSSGSDRTLDKTVTAQIFFRNL